MTLPSCRFAFGMEASGVVSAVGEADAQGPSGPIRVGDKVYRLPGARREPPSLARVSSLVHKPSTLSFEEAAGLMLTGCTAVHAVTVTEVGRGETVVVHGAAGGVGLMAVQLSLLKGARVIGTTSEAGQSMVRELGARKLCRFMGTDLSTHRAAAPEGVDVAIHTVCGTDEAVDASVALVPDRNRIVTIAAFSRGVELGIKVIGSGPGGDPGTEIREAARP